MKEFLWLVFMTILQFHSIHQSGLKEKYLKRIYRCFDSDSEAGNREGVMHIAFQDIGDQWVGYSPAYRAKCSLVFSVDDSVLEKYGKKMEELRRMKTPKRYFARWYSLMVITVAIGEGPGIPIYFHWHKERGTSKMELTR